MNLDQLRDKIDQIDRKLFETYLERGEVVQQVADYKKAHGIEIEHTGREQAVYQNLIDHFGEEHASEIKLLYYLIMNISKVNQQKHIGGESDFFKRVYDYRPFDERRFEHAKIVCQGVPGAYSHLVAGKLAPEKNIGMVATFEDVFQAVTAGDAEFGVLPIENSTAGSVLEIYDLLNRYDLKIVKAVKMEIAHCLLAKPGTALSDVTSVCSHRQALTQCKGFLSRLNVQKIDMPNTAVAAKYVSENNAAGLAAIGSEKSAELYGLDILQKGIQDQDVNYTRFIVVSRENLIADNANKISLTLSLAHKPFTLCSLLNLIAAMGLSLQKIESRPIPEKQFEFLFYLDISGNIKTPGVRALFEFIEGYCTEIKFLGCYPE